MPDYKITRVSQKPPNEWFDQAHNSTIYYISVMVEGHPKPISVGKKKPDALHVGDVISGNILPDYEHGEDKFKATPMAQAGFSGTGFSTSGGGSTTPPKREYVDHSEEIKAQWAIGQAVNLLKDGTSKSPSNQAIELWADTFFEMVDRVKTGQRARDARITVVPEPMDENDSEAVSLYQSMAGGEVTTDGLELPSDW